MTEHHLDLTLEDDRSAVRLRVLADGAELLSARLEAPELDDLIHALAQGHAELVDRVAPELDEGARITDTVVDPAYPVGKNDGRDLALLAFRHPGMGWLGFQLRRPVVEAMVGALRKWMGESEE